ncbi:hypothetical protein [Sinorhizobium fredii]|nr:hypothetical protein [Sinorhizobium fredii]
MDDVDIEGLRFDMASQQKGGENSSRCRRHEAMGHSRHLAEPCNAIFWTYIAVQYQ